MSTKERVRARAVHSEGPAKKQEEERIHELPMMAPPLSRYASQASQPDEDSNEQDSNSKVNSGKSELPPPPPDGNAPGDKGQTDTQGIADLASLGYGQQSVFSVINSEPSKKPGDNVEVENDKKKAGASKLISFAAPPFRFSDGIAQFKLIPKDLPPGEFNESPATEQPVQAPVLENNDFEAQPAPPPPSQTLEDASEENHERMESESGAGQAVDLGNKSENQQGQLPDPRKGQAQTTPENPKPQERKNFTHSNGIPDSVAAQMQTVFNIDISSVKIVQNSSAATAAGALAFAAGNAIHFAPGQFSPSTPQGQQLLGHELAHVVQQQEGRVQAGGEMNGMAINADQRLESEADHLAMLAMNASAPGEEALGASSGNASKVTPSVAPVSQLQDDGSNLYASYRELLAWAAEQKTQIQTDTTTLKESVTQLGEDEKKAVSDLIEAQIQKMKDSIKAAQDHIRSTIDTGKTSIATHRDTKINEVNTTADTEITSIEQLVEGKKKSLQDTGESHACSIEQHGENEANRAITQSNTNANQALSVVSSTAANYQDRDGVDVATAEANKSANELSQEFTELGNTMAESARQDGTIVSRDIRNEAQEAASKFDQPLADARDGVNKKRNETVAALQESGDNLITTLETETAESISALDQQIPTQEASIRAYADGTTETVDKAVQDVHKVIDEQMQNAGNDIDTFVQQIEEIGWYSTEVEAAKADLEAALTAHRSDIDAKKTEMQTQLGAHQTEVQTGADELTSAIDTTLTTLTTDFDNEVNPKIEEVKGEMDTMTTEACDEIKTVKPALEPELDNAIADSEEKWEETVEGARSDMSEKVDTGLETQQETLSDFSSRINDEFSSLPSKDRGFWESLWEGIKDVGAFIGGVFMGLLDGALELIKGIAGIFKSWVSFITAVVVIIVAVLIIAGLAALCGISFGLMALIIGAIVGVGFLAYYIYKAATTEGLSPYERGRLVGRGLFEGIMGFIGTGVLGRLAGWAGRISRIASIVGKVGGLSKFLKMAVWVDDIERLIMLINRTDDIGRLASIFGKLDNARDAAKLLDLIDNVGDASKVMSLFGEGANIGKVLSFIDDASKITTILDKVGDAGALVNLINGGKIRNLSQLDTLLTKLDDISRVEAVLGKVDDVAQLERLLAGLGDDASRLEALLNKTGNGRAAETLLQQLKGMEDRLIAAGITKVDDGSGVIRYLDSAGNEVARMEDFTLNFSYGGHGGAIPMDPNATTTILGKFQDPTMPGWGTEWVHNLPEGSFSRQSSNPGGLNMLDVDPHTWDQLLIEAGGDPALRNEIFWQRYNLPFLEQSFKNGDIIRMLSDPSNPAVRSGTFLRELEAIEGATGLAQKYGYIWDAASQSYRPGPNFAAVQDALRVMENFPGKIGDISEMTALMGRVSDPAVLNSLLGKVDNATQLDNLLNAVGGNAADLDRILRSASDATTLETLLPKFTDVATFERVLGKVENLGQLKTLMDEVDDAAKLEHLLSLTDDAFQLEYYITMSGGRANLQLLEDMLNLAGGPGNASKVQDLIDLTSSSSAWFQRVAEAAKDFQRLPIPNPGWTPKWGFQNVNWHHLFERHTWDWYTFADIKASQGFWPKGTTDVGLRAFLEEALDLMKAANKLPTPNNPQTIQLSSGITVQVGMRFDAGVKIIGQFFPIAGPGVNTLYKAEIEAILRIITP